MTELTIPAADGFTLAATRFDPAGEPLGTVLVTPATGVKRRLYADFARHLTAAGLTVVTWDWRGTGDSRPAGSLRGFAATMRDWATRDLGGVLAWAAVERRGSPVAVVGHSFGGQALGLAPGAERVAALVTVAAQSGYWGHWPVRTRWLYAALWYVLMPGLTRLVDYFPAKRLGMGEDLPRGVALEWARWCRRRDYLGTWDGHRALDLPILGYGFSDDPYAPAPAVDDLLRRYGGPVARRQVTPADAGVAAIGHHGFFRPGVPGLWDETATWLAERLGARAAAVSSAASASR